MILASKPRSTIQSLRTSAPPKLLICTPGTYWIACDTVCTPRSSISCAPTTETDCGISRSAVGVLLPVNVSFATIPFRGPVAASIASARTLMAGSVGVALSVACCAWVGALIANPSSRG
ncbi:hypothetical protein D3C71_1694230 [compost metagenome]